MSLTGSDHHLVKIGFIQITEGLHQSIVDSASPVSVLPSMTAVICIMLLPIKHLMILQFLYAILIERKVTFGYKHGKGCPEHLDLYGCKCL